MSISQDVALKKAGVDSDKTLRVQGSAHVVDVGLARTIKPCKVAPSEGIEHPSKLVFRIVFEECLECLLRLGVIFMEVGGGGIQGRRLFKAMFVVILADGATAVRHRDKVIRICGSRGAA